MNKKIVVTGGTKGLGRAIAERFAPEGFDIAVCARTVSDLESMQKAWERDFPASRLLTYQADVSQHTEVVEFAEFISTEWNGIDVLVNNAGLFIPGKITEEPKGSLETMMEVNLYSAYHLTRALLPMILPHQQGHIFNMCSIASLAAYPNGGSYTIAKFALLGFSKVLRQELLSQGIKVSSIMPGATWSASWEGVDLPEERLMQADDIAKLVWASYDLSDSAVVEDIVIRPQLGDL